MEKLPRNKLKRVISLGNSYQFPCKPYINDKTKFYYEHSKYVTGFPNFPSVFRLFNELL